MSWASIAKSHTDAPPSEASQTDDAPKPVVHHDTRLHMPSSAELEDISLATQKLWNLDEGRLTPEKDYVINVQRWS
jgi:hypothetical protein